MIARARMLRWLSCLLLALTVVLGGCGGGATTKITSTSTGGGGGLTGNIGTTSQNVCTPTNEQYAAYPFNSGTNIAPVYMDNCAVAGTLAASNIPYVSVLLCSPSGTNCAWIDHIQVDTGSIGLRVLASAIPATTLSTLPPVTNAGANLGECYQFVLSYFWGSIRNATVGFGGVPSRTAPAGPGSAFGVSNVHILNDPALPSAAPASCVSAAGSGSTQEASALSIGANGVLGVGMYPDDTNSAAIYYQCPDTNAANCVIPATLTTAQVVPNPVVNIASNTAYRNGVSLTLDTAATIRGRQVLYNSYGVTLSDGTPLTNASSVAGYMTFGIPTSGTGSPTSRLVADRLSQRISANVAGAGLPSSGGGGTLGAFIDSGSNSYFYTQHDISATQLALNTCAGNAFACETPSGTSNVITKSVVLCDVGTAALSCAPTSVPAGAFQGSMTFQDANYLFSTFVYSSVYEGLAAIQPDPTGGGTNPFLGQFDFGLPFFLGRTAWFGFYDATAPATTPYYGL